MQLPGVSRKVSTMCSFLVCPGRRVDYLQLPGVSRKDSRLFAASRCVQKGDPIRKEIIMGEKVTSSV